MKNKLILLAVLALTGCKSLEYVRSLDPVAKGETPKTVEAFMECISLKWSTSGGQLSTLPLANGMSIGQQQPMGGYDVVLDAKRTANGTEYVLYERVPFLTSGSYQQSLKDCR
ncbi:hypothetical protein FML24_27515 [Klebsiella oxytoca]|uniref:hypothetical protein n=1 Tax=Klebsiella TaxID=570 RepID=UPI001886F823|nr:MULTISPECIES: hypothetical protein [Klebsiella]ELR9656852.1 hypothetical protein [Klebsiella oxytoca]MBF1894772.1 hypothetical protein [Klebsiella oxytoca]MBF1901124.1 hypothetical protein [Klebsiella oxytoca]MBF9154349.1 hypothetical protein [Klebsiella oxytoca]MBF9212334.1 hypothetical protein [Klebsiella oxytoca]